MPNGRLTMRKVREILRLKHEVKLSHREVAVSLGVSIGVVSKVVKRATLAGLVWEAVTELSEEEVEARLYGAQTSPGAARVRPDPEWIHTERKRAGVTLELLHLEYLREHPAGYRYTQFCEIYRQWLSKRRVTMRQVHRGGERAYVDYSGKKASVVDRETGEVQPVEIFVGVLGASSYTYAEGTFSQQVEDFISSHVRMLEDFGGSPSLLTPDQLKSGVTTACWYDPQIQRTYEEMAAHYRCAVVPARPGRPRDKAKVEVGVQVVQRWILARLRNEIFFTLAELNLRIRELLVGLNARPMRDHGGKSRRELYELLDRPALTALPSERFVFAEWATARVNIDYHIVFAGSFYSVPHALVHEKVDVRATATTVEVMHKSQRVASHERKRQAGSYSTHKEHMPRAHQEALAWPPSRLIAWADTVGPNAGELVRAILKDRPHPEQGYRPCLGILRLSRVHGNERLDRACRRAHLAGARSFRHVAAILKNRLADIPLDDQTAQPERAPIAHENVRGPSYFN